MDLFDIIARFDSTYSHRKRMAESLAEQYHGSVRRIFLRPHAAIQLAGMPCLVSGISYDGKQVSQIGVSATLPNVLTQDFYLTTRTTIQRYGTLGSLKIFSDRFQKRFRVFCKDEGYSLSFLNETHQSQLLDITEGRNMLLDMRIFDRSAQISMHWYDLSEAPAFDQVLSWLESILKSVVRYFFL